MASLRWLGIALMAVAVPLIPGSGPGVATADSDGSHPWMLAGHILPQGYRIDSCCYGLHMQQDCNLVVYPRGQLDRPLWASNTAGKATQCNLILQDDCNLVMYETGTQNALWASQSAGQGDYCALWMQDDGNVVINSDYFADNPIWATNTNQP